MWFGVSYGISETRKGNCKGSEGNSLILEAVYKNPAGYRSIPKENSQLPEVIQSIPEEIRSIPEVKRRLKNGVRAFRVSFHASQGLRIWFGGSQSRRRVGLKKSTDSVGDQCLGKRCSQRFECLDRVTSKKVRVSKTPGVFVMNNRMNSLSDRQK